MAKRKNALNIRDRIIDFRRVSAAELVPNPKNFRVHTGAQRQYFRSILDSIGFVGVELTRLLPDGRLMLIDGHMRQEEVGDASIPVAVTDLSEEESDAIMATYDALGRLAGTDQEKAASLMESLGAAGHDAAAHLLQSVADNDHTAALLDSVAGGSTDDGSHDEQDDDEDADEGEDDLLPIAGDAEGSTPMSFLTVGKYRVPLTQAESDALVARIEAYAGQNGSYYGFAGSLLRV